MGQLQSGPSDVPVASYAVDRELENLRRHASDSRVASGLMRGVLQMVQKNDVNLTRFREVMLSVNASTHHALAESLILGKQHDDMFRHPIAILVQKTVASGALSVLEITLEWLDVLLGASAAVHVPLHEKDQGISPTKDALRIMNSHGILDLFLHFFDLQQTKALSPSSRWLGARLLRIFASSNDFMIACLSTPVLVIRAIRRLRFASPNTEERHHLVDFAFLFTQFDRLIDGNRSTSVDVHDGAACIAEHADSQLSLIFDAFTGCTMEEEENQLCVIRALRSLNYLSRAICANSSSLMGDPDPFASLPLTERRLRTLFGCAEQRGPLVYGDLTALLCMAVNYNPDVLHSHSIPIRSEAIADGSPKELTYSLERCAHELLRTLFDAHLIEADDVDPVDLLQACDIAHTSVEEIQRLVCSREFGILIRKTADSVVRDPRGSHYWLRLALRIGADANNLADTFASSGGLDLLIGVIEGTRVREHVFGAVTAINRLCVTDFARVTLLQQSNFHVLLRTISLNGSTQGQIYAALETVSILRSMLTKSVLAVAEAFLVEAICSLLCQSLAQCPLVNPRNTAVEAGYISAAQGVMMGVLQLLLGMVRRSAGVARDVFLQLPLDRLRELTHQRWYPPIQAAARELAVSLAKPGAQLNQLLDFQILSVADVVLATGSSESSLERNQSGFSVPCRTTVRLFQRRWKHMLALRKIGELRVSAAALFKAAFLQYNDLVYEQRREMEGIRSCFALGTRQIEENYKIRATMERAAAERQFIIFPEMEERGTLYLHFTEELESLNRFGLCEQDTFHWHHLRSIERLCWIQVCDRDALHTLEARERDAMAMRRIQRQRIIERLYDQRRHLEASHARIRDRVIEERSHFESAVHMRVQLITLEATATTFLTQLISSALFDIEQIRFSVLPALIETLQTQERKFRSDIEAGAERVFATLLNHLHILALQKQEADSRTREERWATKALSAVMRSCYHVALRNCEYRERFLRVRLFHAFSVQWFEITRSAVTLRLQADEASKRVVLINLANAERSLMRNALFVSASIALQATEARARRAIENSYAYECRGRCFDLRLLELVLKEQHYRNALAIQWYLKARNTVVPLSVVRLGELERRIGSDEIAARSGLIMSEWHGFEALKVEFLFQSQTVMRRAIFIERKQAEEELFSELFSSAQILVIRETAKGVIRREAKTFNRSRQSELR